jgi:hypothetical protein
VLVGTGQTVCMGAECVKTHVDTGIIGRPGNEDDLVAVPSCQ